MCRAEARAKLERTARGAEFAGFCGFGKGETATAQIENLKPGARQGDPPQPVKTLPGGKAAQSSCSRRKAVKSSHYRRYGPERWQSLQTQKLHGKEGKQGDNLGFLRQPHLQLAVTCVQESPLVCKFASLSCRLSHCSVSLLSVATPCAIIGDMAPKTAFPPGRSVAIPQKTEDLPPGNPSQESGFAAF